MCTIACILFSAHLQYSVYIHIYIHRIYLYNMYILYIIISTGIMCKNDPITLKIRLFSWGRHECSLPGQDPSSTTSKVLPPGVLCKVHHANICLHPASMPPRMHAVIEWQYLSIYGMVWRWLDIICTFPEQQWERENVSVISISTFLGNLQTSWTAMRQHQWHPQKLCDFSRLELQVIWSVCLFWGSIKLLAFAWCKLVDWLWLSWLWHVVARAPTESNARDVT